MSLRHYGALRYFRFQSNFLHTITLKINGDDYVSVVLL